MEKLWLASYEPGVPEEVDLSEYSSIPHIMETAFEKFADKPAFNQMGKTITYKELQQLSRQFGSYLQNELKLQPGARVALMMPNILQYPVALFGILAAGMVAVNVNPLYTARELQHQLTDSGAETIVIFANSAHVLEGVLDKTPVKNVIITGIGDMLGFPKSLLVNTVIKYVKKMVPAYNLPKAVPFLTALSKGNPGTFRPAAVKHEDIAFLQYTGGTTGVSKGAVLTHKNIVANVLQARAWIGNQIEEGKEIMITPLPLYHIFSLTANCLVFSSIGALNVLITNPRDFANFVKELKKWNFTAMTGVNTLFNALLNTEGFETVDFSHLRTALGGGMAVQEAVAKRWKEVTGTPLVEAYGLTETSPAACMNPAHIREYSGFIGLPISSTLVSIRDDDAKELPINEIGEICIKGPQVTQGYYNRPEETAKVFTEDGFFKTGDMGYMTEKGFVKLVDRKKDMVNVSGFNVYPNEIEDVVVTHPKVLEAAVIGVPDEKSGEAVKLFVVKKDPSLTVEELKDFCKKNLTGYKVPKHYEFKTELPKSNVGKILRKDLRG
ncbi:MAG: AMP-binding protein [Desulfatibacillaceae bacterium]|nr:AMP-binding protein [Desulfatibacillaceae bacterium]